MYTQLVGPLEENESFSVQDYAMLVQLENSSYARSVAEAVGDVAVEGVSPDEDTSAFRSRLALKVSSLLRSQPQQRRLPLPSLKNQHRSTTSQKSLPLSCTGVILQEEFFSFIYRAYIFNSDNFCPFTMNETLCVVALCSGIHLPAPETVHHQITAILDPLDPSMQKWAHLLKVLQVVTPCDISIFLNPQSKLSEVPIKRYCTTTHDMI